MSRFPNNYGHPPNPTVGTNGFVKPGAIATPVPDPIKTGGIGGNTVNFTTGGATLQALRERQQRLQEAAPQLPSVAGMQSPWQGAAYLANTLVNSLQQGVAARQEQAGTKAMMDVFSHIDPATGATNEQLAAIGPFDPDLMIKLWQDRATRAKAEHWVVDPDHPETQVNTVTGERKKSEIGGETYGPVVTGDEAKALGLDPTKSYQLNQRTKQYDQVGGGGTSVTVNPPSAETGAKLGLARGFLDNYDAILKSVDAGEMTGGGYVTGVQLGRGNGGTQYRNLKQGTEALIRIMTGAGMNETEAIERAQQYEPTLTDDAPTLRSKVQGLKQAIDNVIQGVQTRGQPGATPPPATGDGGGATGTGAAGGGGTTAPKGTPPSDAGWPEGISEEDIQETLKAHPDVTRAALKESLSKPRAPNG